MDPRMQARYDRIVGVFREIDPDMSRSFKFEDILDFLTRKWEANGKTSFNRELCQEIFARMNNSLTSIVTVAEFVHFYVLIESKIGENIDLRKKEIKRFTESLSEAEKKLIETRGREQMNQH